MDTNLHIDENMIRKAMQLGHHRTQEEAVTRALKEYVQHLEQEKIVDLFGTVAYDPDYDYKAHR